MSGERPGSERHSSHRQGAIKVDRSRESAFVLDQSLVRGNSPACGVKPKFVVAVSTAAEAEYRLTAPCIPSARLATTAAKSAELD